MPIRGEVVIECDTKGCHAEQVFTAQELMKFTVERLANRSFWQVWSDGRHRCPHCVEEGKG